MEFSKKPGPAAAPRPEAGPAAGSQAGCSPGWQLQGWMSVRLPTLEPDASPASGSQGEVGGFLMIYS